MYIHIINSKCIIVLRCIINKLCNDFSNLRYTTECTYNIIFVTLFLFCNFIYIAYRFKQVVLLRENGFPICIYMYSIISNLLPKVSFFIASLISFRTSTTWYLHLKSIFDISDIKNAGLTKYFAGLICAPHMTLFYNT
jgi:hypothetical protein